MWLTLWWWLWPTNSKNMRKRVWRVSSACRPTKKERWRDEWVHVYSANRPRTFGPSETRHGRFSKKKLLQHDSKITDLLRRLPLYQSEILNTFTIAQAVYDRNGKRWAHDYDDVERLFILGMAADQVGILPSRSNWYEGVDKSVPFLVLC